MGVSQGRVGTLVVGAMLTLLAVPVAVVGPLWVDDWRLDQIVRSVAADWRDFGADKASERLRYELDKAGLGDRLAGADCALEEREEERLVWCEWTAEVGVLGSARSMELSFSSRARVPGPGGD